jgi:hypothetical protein
MIRIPARPRSRRQTEFPLSVLETGAKAGVAETQVCPYLGCARRLRWAPVGQNERGLVCKHHGVVWRSREAA